VLAWLDWAADVADLVGSRPLWAVLARVPRSPFQRAELESALRAHIAPERLGGLSFLPDDPRVGDAAWRAAPLVRGPFVKAVAEVMAAVAPAPRRRGRGAPKSLGAVGA
jgi:hypothetical protein